MNDPDSEQSTATNGERVLLRKRRYQLESIDDNPEPVGSLKTLTVHRLPNLIDDCLLEIFSYLDLLALSNVAKCNTHFKSLAYDVFQRVHHRKLHVRLGVQPWLSLIDLRKIFIEFGPLARGLRIQSDSSLKMFSVDYITKFVCELVSQNFDPNRLRCINLQLWPLTSKDIVELQTVIKCFPNLTDLTLDMLKNQYVSELRDFTEWLPKLEYFSIYGNVNVTQTLAKSWPSLKVLKIFGNFIITLREMQTILSLNPQIEELAIYTPKAYHLLNELMDDLVAYGHHQKLTSLCFYDNEIDPYTFSDKIALFEFLKNLNIHCDKFDPSVENAHLIAKLTHLETINLCHCGTFPLKVEMSRGFLHILGRALINLKSIIFTWLTIEGNDWKSFVALLPKTCKAKCNDLID